MLATLTHTFGRARRSRRGRRDRSVFIRPGVHEDKVFVDHDRPVLLIGAGVTMSRSTAVAEDRDIYSESPAD